MEVSRRVKKTRLCLVLRQRTFFRKVLWNLQKSLGQGQRVCDRKAFGKDFFLMGLRKRDSVVTEGCVLSEADSCSTRDVQSSWLKRPHVVRGGHLRDPAAGNPTFPRWERGIRSEFEDRGAAKFIFAEK